MLIGKIDTGYDDNAKNNNTTGWDILYFFQNENVPKKHKYVSCMIIIFTTSIKHKDNLKSKDIEIRREHASIY